MYRMSLEIPQARVRVEKVFTICFLKGYFCVVNPPTAPRPPTPPQKKQKNHLVGRYKYLVKSCSAYKATSVSCHPFFKKIKDLYDFSGLVRFSRPCTIFQALGFVALNRGILKIRHNPVDKC